MQARAVVPAGVTIKPWSVNMTTLAEALREAIGDERLAAQHGVGMELDKFLESLFNDGFIIVRNPNPSEYGFNCYVCGCGYGGYEK